MFNMGKQPLSLAAMTPDPMESYCLETYSINLMICRHCSHVFNADFNPDNVTYSQAGCRMYNSGAGWQDHIEEVYAMLKNIPVDLVVEIGAGDCEFLSGLDAVDAGGQPSVKLAVDPCEAVLRAEELGLQFDRDYFVPEEHMPSGDGAVLIVMRHLLEHMERPREIIEDICHRALSRSKDKTWVYIEVPNCEVALRKCRIEDWTYEHVQHFTSKSMACLLRNCGISQFAILPKYGSEVLSCFACINPAEERKDEIDVEAVIESYRKTEGGISRERQWMHDSLGQIALWGGAGKSAMFLRKFNLPPHATVVDSHSEKWLMCVPGTKIKISDPSVLLRYPVQYIVATTSWRAEDIAKEIVERNIPCKGLLKFEGGQLVEVPLGRE
jgi:hypothetical protein